MTEHDCHGIPFGDGLAAGLSFLCRECEGNDCVVRWLRQLHRRIFPCHGPVELGRLGCRRVRRARTRGRTGGGRSPVRSGMGAPGGRGARSLRPRSRVLAGDLAGRRTCGQGSCFRAASQADDLRRRPLRRLRRQSPPGPKRPRRSEPAARREPHNGRTSWPPSKFHGTRDSVRHLSTTLAVQG